MNNVEQHVQRRVKGLLTSFSLIQFDRFQVGHCISARLIFSFERLVKLYLICFKHLGFAYPAELLEEKNRETGENYELLYIDYNGMFWLILALTMATRSSIQV
jgi:hypothetical protein